MQPLLEHAYGHQHQAAGCEQLVRNAEDRDHRVDAAIRVGDAHVQHGSPSRCGDERGDEVAGLPRGVGELPQLAYIAQQVADLVSGHTCAVVDGGENEQGLEHDGEVVPERHRILTAHV